MVDIQCVDTQEEVEGVTWKRRLRWRDGWRASGGVGPDVGPTWWETPNRRDCGIQRNKCSSSTVTDHLGLGWQVTSARSETEGRWLHEWAARQGWQRQWKQPRGCTSLHTFLPIFLPLPSFWLFLRIWKRVLCFQENDPTCQTRTVFTSKLNTSVLNASKHSF